MGRYSIECDRNPEQLPADIFPWGSPLWLSLYQKIEGENLDIIRVYRKQDLVAVLPVRVEKKLFLKIASTPLYALYSGPYWVWDSQKSPEQKWRIKSEVWSLLLDYLQKNFHYAQLYPLEGDSRFFSDSERTAYWKVHLRHTLLSDLSQEQVFSNDYMRAVRKAQKNGLKVKRRVDQAEELLAQMEALYKRRNLRLVRLPRFTQELLVQQEKSALRFLTAEDAEGQEIAWIAYQDDFTNKVSYAWMTIASDKAYELRAMHLLTHELLHDLKEEGFLMADHCGADHKGVSQFKEQFSTGLRQQFSAEFFRNSMVRWIYRLRQVWLSYRP
jgi:hypothetical protein